MFVKWVFNLSRKKNRFDIYMIKYNESYCQLMKG